MMEAQVMSAPAVIAVMAPPRPNAAVRSVAAEGPAALSSYQDRVFRLCLGFMGNAADARDLTQETFAKALAHFERDNPGHVQAWLLRIARNSCLDQLRRSKVRGLQQPLSESSAVCWRTPEEDAGAADEIRVVRRAIAALPRRLRDVLVMHEYGELSSREIGRALGIGPVSVSRRLKRARQGVLRRYQEEQRLKGIPKGGRP